MNKRFQEIVLAVPVLRDLFSYVRGNFQCNFWQKYAVLGDKLIGFLKSLGLSVSTE